MVPWGCWGQTPGALRRKGFQGRATTKDEAPKVGCERESSRRQRAVGEGCAKGGTQGLVWARCVSAGDRARVVGLEFDLRRKVGREVTPGIGSVCRDAT